MAEVMGFARAAFACLLVCVAALSACGGGPDATARRIAPWTYRIGCDDGMDDCYDRADGICPYGFHVAGESEHETGARAHTTVIGNTAFTRVRSQREGSLIVECIKPTFCRTQTDCTSLGFNCVWSKRYPGRGVCANRRIKR